MSNPASHSPVITHVAVAVLVFGLTTWVSSKNDNDTATGKDLLGVRTSLARIESNQVNLISRFDRSEQRLDKFDNRISALEKGK